MEKKQYSLYQSKEAEVLLSVRDLQTVFFLKRGELRAVDHVSFDVHKKEILGIVGESGCGKSMTALSVMNLVPGPRGKIVGGEILFRGEDLLKKTETEMKEIQGNHISMIFQEPMTSLNPVLTVGWQIAENLRTHYHISSHEAKQRALEMLHKVNIPMPEQRYRAYPHQLSGGMRQRVMIAMALACRPDLLLCDEPTTALDVTVQAQILHLIQSLQQENEMSVILISHDLGVVSELVDRVIIMYAGEIVEEGSCRDIFEFPMHPYTQALLQSVPRIEQKKRHRLFTISGAVPDLVDLPEQCRFADRCPYATVQCKNGGIPLIEVPEQQRKVRCIRYQLE